jgi:hypothetical protein
VGAFTQAVLEFVHAVRARPATASDPGELQALEAAAFRGLAFQWPARCVPETHTWEVRTVFPSGVAQSLRAKIDIPFPCVIVGFFPTLSQITGDAGNVPTLDDIDVAIDLNQDFFMTQAQGTTTPIVGAAFQGKNTFVTLGSISAARVKGARLHGWVITPKTAQVGFRFRWAQGAGIFQDTHVKINIFARPLDG